MLPNDAAIVAACQYILHQNEYQGDENTGIKVSERCEVGLLKPVTEICPHEGEDVDILAQKSAVDRFYGMMKIPRKLADEIIDMEMWD